MITNLQAPECLTVVIPRSEATRNPGLVPDTTRLDERKDLNNSWH
jgi:hypothetical protein